MNSTRQNANKAVLLRAPTMRTRIHHTHYHATLTTITICSVYGIYTSEMINMQLTTHFVKSTSEHRKKHVLFRALTLRARIHDAHKHYHAKLSHANQIFWTRDNLIYMHTYTRTHIHITHIHKRTHTRAPTRTHTHTHAHTQKLCQQN